MEFRDSPDEAAFRTEVVAWLDRELTGRPADVSTLIEKEDRARWWQERLHEGGWAGITWPQEYGGRGLTILHQAIFNEESARRGAPTPLNLLGLLLAGPTILVHGTDEQKRRFLPKILSGEEVWCQGFSEPAAGSDLAGLQSRATRTDGGWVIDGQKVWTSFGHVSQRCMLLARTDPSAGKHAGITYFCAPMDAVEVRPLVMTNGDADFNELFLSDVHVGDDDVLGGVGNGWTVGLTTLAFERGSLAFTLQVIARQVLDRLVDHVIAVGLHQDELVLDRLGSFHAEVEALRLGAIRSLSAVSAGGAPGPEGSTLKLAWAQVVQKMVRLAVETGGAQATVLEGPAATWALGYLRARGNSIEGGTDEVQRSIIAERVLGLPRSR